MECFIKKIWVGKGEDAHYQFVRFSRGAFENKALLNLQKISEIKIRGSFEWANDFVLLVAEFPDAEFSGAILSREKLDMENEKKKSNLYSYEVAGISGEKIREIARKAYHMLLDAEAEDITLKIKKKLPKPGKSGEKKVDNKFCQIEANLKYWSKIQEAFMLPECRKCRISHTYIIEKLILPENEKDLSKMREMARRKGKIIRKLEIDKKKSVEEREFEA